jgi:hypothetical protein
MITYFLDAATDHSPAADAEVNFNTPTGGRKPPGPTVAFHFADGTSPAPVNQAAVPAADNENQIRSVNVYIGTRSATRRAGSNQYIRSNLTTQVALRSMAYFNTY